MMSFASGPSACNDFLRDLPRQLKSSAKNSLLNRLRYCTRQPRRHALICGSNANDNDPELIELDTTERMEKTITSIRGNMNTVRTGRANPAILERIEVAYYGSVAPLNTIANASTPDSQTVVIKPFDSSMVAEIEKAIMNSDLGLTPSNDGNCIRLSIPPLTAERRKELVKLVSKLGEEGKVALRNVRRDALKSVGKLNGIPEDELRSLEECIDKITSNFVKQVDELVTQKEKEITKV